MPEKLYTPALPRDFVAIDFETATRDPDSACQIGLVKVKNRQIVQKECRLIKPPPPYLKFAPIHGITWNDVQGEPIFSQVWDELVPLLEGAKFLVAHNSTFDRAVLAACCNMAGILVPGIGWECSMRIADKTWGLKRKSLADICAELGIEHGQLHNAGEDALACAKIVLAAIS